MSPMSEVPLTYGPGSWVEYRIAGQWDRARWLGPTGRDSRGRFVRPGNANEAYLLDSGVTYTRLSIDRGTIRIRPTALCGYAFDLEHEHRRSVHG